MRFIFMLFLMLSLSVAQAKSPTDDNKRLRLATTTSTENSGLLEYLLPDFEKQTGYTVHVIAVGTGKALRMGRDGDVDVLLVHAPEAEETFVNDGYGVDRTSVMHNDFVIVGSKADPAKLSSAATLLDALQNIINTKSQFVSRGDDSGTHKKELSLWQNTQRQSAQQQNIQREKTQSQNAHIKPSGKWYIEAGQGMGKVLQMAGEMDAYTLTDRGTWLAYQNKSPLSIVFEGDEKLFNPYSIIAVNPKRYADSNYQGAKALIAWISSKTTQQKIADFAIHEQQLFIPDVFKLTASATVPTTHMTTSSTN